MPGDKFAENVRYPLALLTKSARLVLLKFPTPFPPQEPTA